jgi:hypothetical protein
MDSRLKLLRHADRIAGLQTGNFLPPVMVDVDPVDGVCNLDCEWCCQAASRASRPATFMSKETMRGLGEFCASWGVKSWRIAGDSEPLLNKEISELLAAGNANGVDLGLITNGVHLDRLTQNDLRRLHYLGVSLDATTPFTWSQLKRSDPVNFGKILTNVRRARELAPQLDISLKFLRWKPGLSLDKGSFSGNGLPVLTKMHKLEDGNYQDAEALAELAQSLGVHGIIKDAYPADFHRQYQFEKCHATPLGGVFDASHKFHLCCDARNRFVLTDDYTRDGWGELPSLWGGEKHKALIDSIVPQKCAGCAKYKMNQVLEQIVVSPQIETQVNFI